METSLLDRAKNLAHRYHAGQTRWDGSPYITHPESVVNRLKKKGFDGDTLIVGWLHDVVEDTEIGIDSIYAMFGNYVGEVVDRLTHRKGEPYAEYILRISLNFTATNIKIADLEDNLSDLDPVKQKQRIDKYELAKLFLETNLR